MEDDPEDVFAYIPLPDEDSDERAFRKRFLAIFFDDLLKFEDEVLLKFEDEVPFAEIVEFSDEEQIAEGVEFSDEEQIAEGVEFSDEEQIAEGVEFSDDDSLVHEPLLGQRDEIWNDILEWPDLELNSISCGVESPDGAFTFSVALKDRIHWDKLIYLQEKQPWDYIDLENAPGVYDEFEDLEFALHHAYLPVPSLISYSEALHHTDLPVHSSISPRLELQESGHPCREYDGSVLFVDGDEDCLESSSSGYLVRDGSDDVDGDEDCLESSSSGYLVRDGSDDMDGDEDCLESSSSGYLARDGSDDALNQECEALAIDDRLGHHEGSHSRSDLGHAVLTELSLESTHLELQSNLPAAEDLNFEVSEDA